MKRRVWKDEDAMRKMKNIVLLILSLVMAAGLLTGCQSAGDESVQQTAQEEGLEGSILEAYSTAKIGIITGSSHELTAKEYFPDAERIYFNNMADMVIAADQGKIDCYIEDAPFAAALIWEGLDLVRLEEPVKQVDSGFVFPQGEDSRPLREEINAFLAEVREDGTVEQLKEKWMGAEEPTEHPDYTSLSGENGTIRLAISVDNKPLLYQTGERYTGLEMEILTLFAQRYGYGFEIEVVPFESILAGIATGKYHMGASALNITPEREESVDFSDPYSQFDVVLMVKGDGAQSQQSQRQADKTLADLENATLGVVTGTSWDLVAQENFPQAERKYFTSTADVLLALEQGKVDAFFADQTVYAGIRWENPSVVNIDEPIRSVSNALILAKEGYDEKLLREINEFVTQTKGDGTLDRLSEKWFSEEEPAEHPDYTKLTGENGTLRIAVGDAMKPTAYQKGSLYTGYEVEFLTLFAEAYGYQLDVQGMAFEALIPSVASGKCDIGACGITITPERAESVTFADPHFETYGVAVVWGGSASQSSKKTLESFEEGDIGVLTGSSYENLVKERFPDAKRHYYTLMSDLVLAVEQGKIDGYISEMPYFTAAVWEGSEIAVVEEALGSTEVGFIFQKDSELPLREEMNAFVRSAKENGLLDRLNEKWFSGTEPTEHPDYTSLTGENGTLKVAVAPDVKPVVCYEEDGITGYEMDILVEFARAYGYQLELTPMSFDAILPGVTSGKYDIGSGGINITEERAQSVDFSESHMTVDIVMVVSGEEELPTEPTFWDNVKESFRKTFIREDRWKLIVDGVGVTMLISICAAVAGTLLGFGLYMLGRSDVKAVQKVTRGIAKVYSRIIAGTPVVVILMILFYVVFGQFRDMSGVLVAIIGFTLTFGAFVYDHMTVSVNSVDRGQTEAAYALGYTKNQTFFRIILPQAMTIFMPSYCGQAVELIKATAVVGYIAVNDLTKVGDIIRSNTYEAFFPLIATAVIYFLLTWILSLLLGRVKIRFEPKRRKMEDILKGVKTV